MKLMSMTFFLSSVQHTAIVARPDLPWITLVNTLLAFLNEIEYSHTLDIEAFSQDLEIRLGSLCPTSTDREILHSALTSFQTEFTSLYRRLEIPSTSRVELNMTQLRVRDYVLEIRVSSRSRATYPLLSENSNVVLH